MMRPTRPRAESRPLRADELTGDQREALRRIARFIATIAHQASGHEARSASDIWSAFVPTIDAQRRNHVFLIDGARGSGKSAALVTLLELWSRALRGRVSDLVKYDVEIPGRKAIVPIGLIDLHPMDRSTHLMMHVVGQFQRLVETLQAAREPTGSRGESLWRPADASPSGEAWRAFVRAAAAGWDTDFAARKKTLAPEQYAFELEDRERRRLEIDSAFRKLVDTLVSDYREWPEAGGGSPVFVIGIDDADMNVERTRELLDLLRVLWHPRVAFVLTGDSELFLDILRRDLRRQTLPEGRIDGLARDIYDKVVPVPHRFALPPLAPAQRVDTLRSLLSDMQASLSPPVNRLLEQCTTMSQVGRQSATGLPDRLRQLQHLAHAMQLPSMGTVAGFLRALLEDARRQYGTLPYDWRYDPDDGVLHVDVQTEWKLVWSRHVDTPLRGQMRLLRLTRAQLLIPEQRERDGEEIPDEQLLKAASEHISGIALLAHLAHREQPDKVYWYSRNVVNARWVRIWYGHLGRSIRWRFPRWRDIDRVMEATDRWLEETRQVPATVDSVDKEIAWLAAVHLYVPLGLAKFDISVQLDEHGQIQWQSLAAGVSDAANAPDDPTLATWARSEAVLLAAPESGLPAEAANAWLLAFKQESERRGLSWRELAPAIRERRDDRASQLRPELANFDRANPGHKFADITGYERAMEVAREEALTDKYATHTEFGS